MQEVSLGGLKMAVPFITTTSYVVNGVTYYNYAMNCLYCASPVGVGNQGYSYQSGATCLSPNNLVTRNVVSKVFYPRCPKVNNFCNPKAGAYVPAITVCNQRLWTYATSTYF